MASFDYRIRYGECDQQGIVFNAHYMAFIDDAMDCWLRELDAEFEANAGWEVTVKRSDIVWDSPARSGEVLTLDLAVSRWGNTSFDLNATGRVGDRAVIDSTTTYVVVSHPEFTSVPIPEALREHLSA
ncbi:MAG: hotdog domain-containing protein [Acidimicrobiales bacterium]|jgi:acyl-CoA thioester hydrolase|nr:hotdog domain-containing protein [Acidimicrobiales bacterium]